ncbi:MAG: hypothetical protein CMH27_03025 [Micavibrio sp.]|nr:hypothetical protein [Micavibrio sp.]|tara:strand:- start:802 stop:2238 length:1437 start_codon:yes stop_codon:yes gene_type:complete
MADNSSSYSPSSSKKSAPHEPYSEAKLKKLTQALLLERQVRNKASQRNEIGFHITNDTFRLFPYRQCYLWSFYLDKVKVTHASGVSHVDDDSGFMQWFTGFVKRRVQDLDLTEDEKQEWASVHVLSQDDCGSDDQVNWDKWLQSHAVMVLFWSPAGRCFGGLWFDRDTPFQESDRILLSHVSGAYAHALYMLQRLEQTSWPEKVKNRLWGTNLRRAALIGLGVVALFPVRLSATAPSEVIPLDPYMISAPMDAVVDDILVEPNQHVEAGDILVTFDDTQLRSEKAVAEKEVQILSTELSQASRQAFSEDRSKAQLALISAQIEMKSAEISYLNQQLMRMSVKAPHAGQVVFNDASELRGQPMRTGQRLMLLAKPQNSELLVRVPVDNMVQINHDVPIRAFLNIAPLKQYNAKIHYISYKAGADTDGLMTYKIKARFTDTDARPAIGLQGTAKVYGNYTILAYHILRRPVAWLRKHLGL